MNVNQPGKPVESSRPTARDVAQRAGVSQSTVSRILAGHESTFFSQGTRQRVLEAARELGYSPDPNARALRGKQTKQIGLIVRDISDPFFAELVSALIGEARTAGYQAVLGYARIGPHETLHTSHVLDTRQTDGVIILGDWWDDEQAIREIIAVQRAVVAMCRGASPAEVLTINTDNRSGILDLCEHLVALGHYRLGFLQGTWMGDFDERHAAFQEFIQTGRAETRPEWLIPDTDDAPGGYRAMQRLLACPERPTAVLAADDLMAIGALKAVADQGLSVPDDLSIAGFDGISMAGYVHPALTTVRQPVEAMGRQAFDGLLAQIRNEPLPAVRLVRVPPLLVVRESTARVGLRPSMVRSSIPESETVQRR